MASKWYLKSESAERGPLMFADLVGLVRSEELLGSDLVRPDWKTEWQRADSVVGLFYMARRSSEAPVVAEASPEPVAEETAESLEDVVTPASPAEQPAWLQQLLQFFRTPIPATAPRESDGELDDRSLSESSLEPGAEESSAEVLGESECESELVGATAAATSAEWSDTIQAALDRAEALSPGVCKGHWAERRQRWFGWLGSSRVGVGVRLLMAIVCVVLVTREVERLSKFETVKAQRMAYLFERQADAGLRHRPPPLAADARHFPLLGNIDRSTYLALLVSLALVTGASVYGAGKLVERMG